MCPRKKQNVRRVTTNVTTNGNLGCDTATTLNQSAFYQKRPQVSQPSHPNPYRAYYFILSEDLQSLEQKGCDGL
jgi:hypothetical protein